jgi:hypothetical protein
MSRIAIRIENRGKMYRIGGRQEEYQTFCDPLIPVALDRGDSAPPNEHVGAKDILFVSWRTAS